MSPRLRPLYILFLGLTLLSVLTAPVAAHGSGPSDDSVQGSTTNNLNWALLIPSLSLLSAVPIGIAYSTRTHGDSTFTLERNHALGFPLVAFSAGVHAFLFVKHDAPLMAVVSLGFVGGYALSLWSGAREQQYLKLAAIPFIAVQIALWVMAGLPHLFTFGLLDKLSQVALLGLIVSSYLDD